MYYIYCDSGCSRWVHFKASAHIFKCFTSRVRLSYCFTPYQRLWLYNGAPLASDVCHASFYLNADSPAEKKTEQVNITKNVVRSRIRTPKIARLPDLSYVFVLRRFSDYGYIMAPL